LKLVTPEESEQVPLKARKPEVQEVHSATTSATVAIREAVAEVRKMMPFDPGKTGTVVAKVLSEEKLALSFAPQFGLPCGGRLRFSGAPVVCARTGEERSARKRSVRFMGSSNCIQ
jgi:hypothetical protein